MTPHLPHGVAVWIIAVYYLLALPIALAVHWWRNRIVGEGESTSKRRPSCIPDDASPTVAHPPTGALPLVEGRRVSTSLPARAGVRAMFDPGKGTRP